MTTAVMLPSHQPAVAGDRQHTSLMMRQCLCIATQENKSIRRPRLTVRHIARMCKHQGTRSSTVLNLPPGYPRTLTIEWGCQTLWRKLLTETQAQTPRAPPWLARIVFWLPFRARQAHTSILRSPHATPAVARSASYQRIATSNAGCHVAISHRQRFHHGDGVTALDAQDQP